MIYWTWKGSLATGKITKIKPYNERHHVEAKGDYVTNGWTSYKLGRDAFETEDDCRAAALRERDKKIVSLEKQIKKLRAMTFPAAGEGK